MNKKALAIAKEIAKDYAGCGSNRLATLAQAVLDQDKKIKELEQDIKDLEKIIEERG